MTTQYKKLTKTETRAINAICEAYKHNREAAVKEIYFYLLPIYCELANMQEIYENANNFAAYYYSRAA